MGKTQLGELLNRIDRLRDAPRKQSPGAPDGRDGAVYRADPDLRLAVKLALATGRPLLLRGEPGSGKSSLAAYVARNLGWRYYEVVITSRSQAQDLLWKYDAVRRLAAATDKNRTAPLRDTDYVEPGALWWVLNPATARLRGADVKDPPERLASDPNHEINRNRRSLNAVVLLDEIDKADPDVPNGLLVPLGSSRFEVAETGAKVELGGPDETPSKLVVITTNEERELPQAFVRRCIVHRLTHPDTKKLMVIADRHLKNRNVRSSETELEYYRKIAERLAVLRDQAVKERRRPPSTAEFLDAVFAVHQLGHKLAEKEWDLIERLVLIKE